MDVSSISLDEVLRFPVCFGQVEQMNKKVVPKRLKKVPTVRVGLIFYWNAMTKNKFTQRWISFGVDYLIKEQKYCKTVNCMYWTLAKIFTLNIRRSAFLPLSVRSFPPINLEQNVALIVDPYWDECKKEISSKVSVGSLFLEQLLSFEKERPLRKYHFKRALRLRWNSITCICKLNPYRHISVRLGPLMPQIYQSV